MNLGAFVIDRTLEIDNNLIAHAIRPLTLGRNNYLFADSDEVAKWAAVIHSVLAMCMMEDVNPF